MANLEIDVIGGTPGVAQGAASGAAFGGIGAAAGAIIGGGLSMLGSRNASKRMEILSQEQRKWEEAMAKTAHWWEAHDLESAGLNRILTATGGSGMAYHGSPPAPTLDYITPGVSSAVATGRAVDEMKSAATMRDNVKQDTNTKESSERLNNSLSGQAKAAAGKQWQEQKNLQVQEKILKEDLVGATASAKRAENMMKIDESELGEALRWVERFRNLIFGGGSNR